MAAASIAARSFSPAASANCSVGRLAFAANDQADQRGERRIEVRLPRGQLGGGEAGVVVVDGGQDRVVVGRKRLHEHAAALVAAAGAAGDLRDELKRPLGRPQVAKVQRRVGVDHADQRHVRKVEPLGDHLRAQQDLHLAARESGPAPPRGCRASASCRCPSAARGTSGKRPLISASSRSVPKPVKRMPSNAHSRAADRRRHLEIAVVADRLLVLRGGA